LIKTPGVAQTRSEKRQRRACNCQARLALLQEEIPRLLKGLFPKRKDFWLSIYFHWFSWNRRYGVLAGLRHE
jgi:hypothetical protein